ncbi:putative permease [Onchocerca flexuosa]|uniref:Putative permease n=1 Tax=Onchocerca flexuosa TaxID=387005 RepID=A0A238BWL9_9BILA|nr:putative permease [Onchocerca flexuosa]
MNGMENGSNSYQNNMKELPVNGIEVTRKRRFYKANENPPILLALLFALQQVMVCVSALLTIPFILSNELCAGRDVYTLRVLLISSTFVVSGLSTIIQTMLGTRLALLQGTAFAYIPSIQVFMQLPEYKCTFTDTDIVAASIYQNKLAIIQGCLIASSLVPIIIGMTGIVGVLTKFIGPITVSPLMLLLVLSAVDLCVERISKHWVAVIRTNFPFKFSVSENEDEKRELFICCWLFNEYLIAILTSWGFCLFLTLTNLTAPDSAARLDKNETLAVIKRADWLRFPYPGVPQFHTGLFCAFVISALTSVFESVGDYHAAARVSEERSPPSHAINRGILAEGCGSLLAGLLGPGVGMTTHTENIGVIGVTRVASRFTMVLAGVLLILLGVFTKIGALLSTIPDPLVGGILASSMAMVDLKCTRNVAVLGFSIMVGMIVPSYFRENPIDTGIAVVNQVLTVLLTLPMFVGAFVACVLDNTVSGATREQRGLRSRGLAYELGENNYDVYAFPAFAMKLVEQVSYLKVLPFIPKEKKITNRVNDSLP